MNKSTKTETKPATTLAAVTNRIPKPSRKAIISAAVQVARDDFNRRQAEIDTEIEACEKELINLLLVDYASHPDNYTKYYNCSKDGVLLTPKVSPPAVSKLQMRLETLKRDRPDYLSENNVRSAVERQLDKEKPDAVVALLKDPAARAALEALVGIRPALTLNV